MKESTPVSRWHRHVATVQAELKNAAAPPPWWTRIVDAVWRNLNEYVNEQVAPREPVLLPPRHEPACAHLEARETTLGAVISRPKARDEKLLGIEAVECPTCKIVVALMQ